MNGLRLGLLRLRYQEQVKLDLLVTEANGAKRAQYFETDERPLVKRRRRKHQGAAAFASASRDDVGDEEEEPDH